MENDPLFEPVLRANTSAPNFQLDTAAIIQHLTSWRAVCNFTITAAESDRVDISFHTLPADMTAFVADMYSFCPDIVDQGTGCVAEMVEAEDPETMPEEMKELVQGVDFQDDDYGLEILKRILEHDKKIMLWWD